MIDRPLGELVLAPDAVHDRQVLLAGRDVGDEVEEVVRLARETQGVEAPEHEGAVANPGVAIVPVALAADRLGQRGGRRREEGAGRAVGEAFERERAPLQEALPRMLGKLAAVDPLAPEIRRSLDAGERLVGVGRRRVLGPELARRRVLRARPRERDVRLLALAQGLAGMRAPAFEAGPEVGDQAEGDVAFATFRAGLAVARPGGL